MSDQLENQNPSTSSTSGQPDPAIEVLQRQLNALTQGFQQFTSQFNQQIPPAPSAPNYNINPDDWNDPSKTPLIMADIIRKEVQHSMAPMNEFRKTFERKSSYESIKAQVKAANPQLSTYWNHIEPYLDNAFGGGNIDVNPQLVMNQAQAILGGLVLQNPALFTNRATPPAQMISSSGSPTPVGTPEPKKLRELDANEEHLRKQRGLTHEQFLQLQEGSVMILESAATRGGK